MIKLHDRVKELSYVIGTGNITLSGAVRGFATFSSCYSNNDLLFYAISDGANYELGSGLYISASNSISRFPVKSTNSNNRVNFPVGTKEVYVNYPATNAVFNTSGINPVPQNSGIAFWTSSNSLSYSDKFVVDSGRGRLGINNRSPSYALDLGGLSPNSIIRSSGFLIGNSGIIFPSGNDGTSAYSGGVQLVHFEKNQLSSPLSTILQLSGIVNQNILLKKQNVNTFLAGPSGACDPPCDPDYPTFRFLTKDDVPQEISNLSIGDQNSSTFLTVNLPQGLPSNTYRDINAISVNADSGVFAVNGLGEIKFATIESSQVTGLDDRLNVLESGVIEDVISDDITYGRKNGDWIDLASAAALQFRQGTNADRLAMDPVPAMGEPIFTTDLKRLFIGDGATVGGRSIVGDTNSYILCQPGDDIQAKYAAAKLLTPNGSALSATNRAALVVMPGNYPISASGGNIGQFSVGILMDTNYVDILGVGSSTWNPSFTLSGSPAVIAITADDVVLCGCRCSTYAGTGGSNRFVVNCAGGVMYGCGLVPTVGETTNVYGGTIIGCIGLNFFGSSASSAGPSQVFNGTIINCRMDVFIFRQVIFQGVIKYSTFVLLTDGFFHFRGMQGRIENCSFLNCATANLPPRSSDYGIVPAAFTGTCSISQSSPAIITKANHGFGSGSTFRSGWRIRFATTGSLPTGLNTTTTYYVTVIDVNTFKVSTSLNGAFINTTSAGTGDHSIVIPPGVEGGRYSFCTTSDGEYTSP